MPFLTTDIPGLIVIEPPVYEDKRGHFFEAYNETIFQQNGINCIFVQDNQSLSHHGVIRGLHYQLPPHAQAKLVRVLRGTILDVVIDIRKGSPDFGKSFSIELSHQNNKQLFIPAGFAHGFSVQSETAQVLYKCDAYYNKESEAGIRFDDPALAIDWGVPSNLQVISEKDLALPLFADCKNSFVFKG